MEKEVEKRKEKESTLKERLVFNAKPIFIPPTKKEESKNE